MGAAVSCDLHGACPHSSQQAILACKCAARSTPTTAHYYTRISPQFPITRLSYPFSGSILNHRHLSLSLSIRPPTPPSRSTPHTTPKSDEGPTRSCGSVSWPMNPLGSQATGSADASSTALRGASVAFQHQKAKPAPAPPRKDNGALSAATTAGLPGFGHQRTQSWQQQQQQQQQQPFVVQGTGGSFISDAAEESRDRHGGAGAAARFGGGGGPAGGHLYSGLMPGGPSRVDSKSPSFIAATLAASRSVSPSPAGRSPIMRGGYANGPNISTEDVRLGQGVDSGSIPPTGALISMFEKARVELPPTVGDRVMEERMREQARMAAARVQPVTVDLGGWSVEMSPKAHGDERHLPELTADALARLGPPGQAWTTAVSGESGSRVYREARCSQGSSCEVQIKGTAGAALNISCSGWGEAHQDTISATETTTRASGCEAKIFC